MIVITFFCISVIIGISYFSYIETSQNINNSYDREVQASENLFLKSSVYIHKGLKLWDSTYNDNLKRNIQTLIAAYTKSGSNPGQLNLSEIVAEFDPLYKDRIDVYFINSSGIIEYTTDETEYQLDFKIWPDFWNKIRRMMQSDDFFPDDIVKGFLPGAPLRKFVYQSTPDHHYLAQIGLTVQNDSVKERRELSYSNLVSYVLSENPDLKTLHVISSMGNLIIGKKDYPGGRLDEETRKIVESVFSTRERIIITDPRNQLVTTYIFIPNNIEKTPSANYINRVGKFVFSTEEHDRRMGNNFLLHFFLVLFASLFSIIVAALITYRITSPLNLLVTEIDRIAEGNLDQQISETMHPELGQIANAVRTMVFQITGTIRELQASESRFRSLFYTATDAILIADDDQIIEANLMAEMQFLESGVTLSGMYMEDICPQVSTCIREFQKVYTEQTTGSDQNKDSRKTQEITGPNIYETDVKTDDSDETGRILNVRIVPLGSGTHPLLQIQIRDITKRVKMEEEIQNLNEDLERQVAERTASLQATIADLDSFSYTVSHDLRAPLRTIDGNAHILVMKGGDMITPELHQYIDRIHKSIKKMDNLIDDLLKFSRMSRKPFEKTDIDMNQLVAEVVDELLASDILSHTHVKISQLPGAQGDQTLIRQVLINLISNAIKFGKPGVTNEVTISAQSIEGLVWYCVQDTGIGFDMQYADRIFEVFLQLNPAGSFEGTGVGLAIVKRIIQRHGGRIHVSSQEGEGSTFSFTLDEQYNRENGKQITR
jgi:signal transduction histidine kinase/HAMP domain-containing protein